MRPAGRGGARAPQGAVKKASASSGEKQRGVGELRRRRTAAAQREAEGEEGSEGVESGFGLQRGAEGEEKSRPRRGELQRGEESFGKGSQL